MPSYHVCFCQDPCRSGLQSCWLKPWFPFVQWEGKLLLPACSALSVPSKVSMSGVKTERKSKHYKGFLFYMLNTLALPFTQRCFFGNQKDSFQTLSRCEASGKPFFLPIFKCLRRFWKAQCQGLCRWPPAPPWTGMANKDPIVKLPSVESQQPLSLSVSPFYLTEELFPALLSNQSFVHSLASLHSLLESEAYTWPMGTLRMWVWAYLGQAVLLSTEQEGEARFTAFPSPFTKCTCPPLSAMFQRRATNGNKSMSSIQTEGRAVLLSQTLEFVMATCRPVCLATCHGLKLKIQSDGKKHCTITLSWLCDMTILTVTNLSGYMALLFLLPFTVPLSYYAN